MGLIIVLPCEGCTVGEARYSVSILAPLSGREQLAEQLQPFGLQPRPVLMPALKLCADCVARAQMSAGAFGLRCSVRQLDDARPEARPS